MNETKFFCRVDKHTPRRLWRIREDGAVDSYSGSGKFWEPDVPDFDLHDPKASRPIDIAEVRRILEFNLL